MVAEAWWSFRSTGGPKGQEQLIWDERSDSGTPPPVVTLALFGTNRPSLGSAYTMSRPTTTSRPEEEQPEPAANEDLVDLRRRRTSGATVRCQRGVFPSGFPRHVADLGPIHHSTVIPTAGGAASAAAAQPRIGAAPGGGLPHGILRGRPREYEYEYGMLCIRTGFGVGKPTVDAL